MCLSAVDEKTKRTPGIGYKVVQKKDGSYYSWDYARMSGKVEYPLNRWIEDDNPCTILSDGGKHYQTGFHVCLNHLLRDKSAHCLGLPCFPKLRVIQVKFKKVVASGHDYPGEVVVVRKLINKGEIAWQ